MSVSTLGYAILGLLARELLSGYDLTNRMRERVVEQQGRPDKKVYSDTEAGLDALKAWVAEPPTPRAVRDEMVLKAYSVWLVDPEGALTLFREQERQHRERLARYEEIEAWMQKEWGRDLEQIDSPRFASYTTLQRGKGYEREYAEWCGWLADLLEKGAGQIKEDRG